MGLLSFGILVGDRRALWIELHVIMILGFCNHDIIPPIAWNLCLEDSRTVNNFNDTLHMSFVKHYIYQKVNYLHIQAIYQLPSNISQSFEPLDELISGLLHEHHRS